MATNIGWISQDTPPVAGSTLISITCSAGVNKSQEYLGPVELTGTAGGGTSGATLAYEWTLLDPDGNQRNYWITGSNLLTMSFSPVDFPFAGSWVASLVVSSDEEDDPPQSSSATVTVGSGSWLRFNPNYGIVYHYTGSTAVSGPYQTLVWEDSGRFTSITMSVPPADKDNVSEMSIQWINSTLPIAGSSSIYTSGTLLSVDTKIIYDVSSMLTTSEEFYAGWTIANPANVDGFGNENWSAMDGMYIGSWYGGTAESNTQKVAKNANGSNFSWLSGKTGPDRVASSFLFENQQVAPKCKTISGIQRISGTVALEDAIGTNANRSVLPTASIMYLGAFAGRGDGGLTLTASARIKMYYRFNRGSWGGDRVF